MSVNDPNAGEFVVQSLAQVQLRFGSLLSQRPDIIASINQILSDALTGINLHKVALTYTNIAICKAWNLIAIGLDMNDPVTLASGERLF